MTNGSEQKTSTFAFMLRALRYRNYRLFFFGQMVSLVGTWMANVAGSWLVYRLTGSPLLLGVIGFAGQLPAFILSPFAGIFVDRWNKQKILMATQILAMVQSFLLGFLILTGKINIPVLIFLSVAMGLINAFDLPCRQSLVIEMIEKKEDIGNAIALNSSMFNLARLVGPAIGGGIIGMAGEGWCFVINGFSFFTVIAALLALRIPPKPPAVESQSTIAELRAGFKYAFGFMPIRSILLLLGLVCLVGIPHAVLIPVFAGSILGGGPHTLGFLMTAFGCGSLLAALCLAARKTVVGLARAIPLATATFGAGLIAFSFSRALWLSVILMLITGFGFMIQMASSNTILQTIVDDDKRGRVMGFFMMAFLGVAPFGSLVIGGLAEKIGTPQTVALEGVCCILGAIWFAGKLPSLRKEVRPIYVRIGILPEVAAGLETATELTAPPED